MRVPSVMGHKFSEVPRADIPRSQFDRSFGYKTTFDAGYLIPFFVDEALPGDTFVMNMTGFARMATPLKPIMDNLFMDTFFFFVPYRLIWSNWEKFNGAQDDPGDSTDFTVPQITLGGGTSLDGGTLWDYFGLPQARGAEMGSYAVSALPSRAYNLVYNEWFRDQNLQDSLVVDKDDGPDAQADYVLRRRGKRHDYFTSCLPWPQKGPAIQLPMAGDAPVVAPVAGTAAAVGVQNPGLSATYHLTGDPSVAQNLGGGTNKLYADLSAVTSATINELRQAFQLQKLLERDARGGTRYTEILRAHFGVTSPDARLQRPEYLGGGSTPVSISPIAQTSEDASTPQGNLAAIGTVSWSGHGFSKSFTEHGVVLGLVSVRADLTYSQGIDRMWSRLTRYDFYWPALAHIGEQAVLNKEIWTQGGVNPTQDAEAFGYQERYAEYRYKPSKVTGLMRPDATGTLAIWNLSQDFASLPQLNAAFIVEDPPIDRVIATPTEPHFLFDAYCKLRCARPMPLFGVPGLIDHF